MRKHSVQVIIVFILMLVITSSVFAKTKTVYQTKQPIPIITKLGSQTVLFFASEVEFATSNTNKFQIQNDKKNNKLTITPRTPGAETNLIVTTKSNERYEFRLIESDKQDYDGIVDVKSAPEINYKDVINLVNKRKVSIDPAVRKLVNIYDIGRNRFKFQDPSLEIIVNRAVTIKSLNKTVFWFRVYNNLKNKIVDIPINSVDIKERELFALAVESNKQKLKPGEFADYYVLVEGTYLDNSYTVQMTVNSEEDEFKITNIPYNKQEFKVFVVDGNNYLNVKLEDYRR